MFEHVWIHDKIGIVHMNEIHTLVKYNASINIVIIKYNLFEIEQLNINIM